MKGREAVPAGRFWVEGYEAVLDGKFWVEVTRESFRWRILGEGARGSSSRSASAVSKSSQLFRHLSSSGPSANAEHSWLEHPTPHGTSFPVRSRSAEELPQIFCSLKQRVFYKCRTLLAAALRASPHTIPPLKQWAWQVFLSLRKTAGRRWKADPL